MRGAWRRLHKRRLHNAPKTPGIHMLVALRLASFRHLIEERAR